MLSSGVLPVFNTQDKTHTPRVLLTPQRACLVPQRGASERPGWDSSAGMELLTPSSPSRTSAHTAGQPLGQQQLDTCCSCVLGCVLWSLFTLTWFSRITSPLPIFCQPHVKKRHLSFRASSDQLPLGSQLLAFSWNFVHP